MARTRASQPTEAELAILRILWSQGPSTVREVHETLGRHQSTGYTTTLKLMQIMAEKGLVDRDESRRTHVYRARLSQNRTQRQLVQNLLDKAFGGSAKDLIMQALSAKRSSPQELAEIRKLLHSLEGERQ
jgi:predicted transcriptional regulator